MDSLVGLWMACCMHPAPLTHLQAWGDRVTQALGASGKVDLRVAEMGLRCPVG